MAQPTLETYDHLLHDGSAVAAVTYREWLIPAEGRGAVVFPPTYARPETIPEHRWLGYNIDQFDDGFNVCLIDSVGSQANRMEPLFKMPPYNELVPQVEIVVKDGTKVHLLDAGHRIADAVVRFSALEPIIHEAFLTLKKEGDATRLAKIAPTSLVFGVWDSRATQVKVPRVVRSVVRAYRVRPLHRSAQYIPPVDYQAEGLVSEGDAENQKVLSEIGLAHAPAAWTHGGVLVEGEIRRDAIVNLAALRSIRAGADDEATLRLRRYLLGLALVAFTQNLQLYLREGCELVRDPERPPEAGLVRYDGQRESLELDHDGALHYARLAAEAFGVGEGGTYAFDQKKMKAELQQSKQERKKRRRGGGE